MNLKQIVDGYAVTPQLDPADMAALAESGVTTVICNRPDAENPPGCRPPRCRGRPRPRGWPSSSTR
jgi:uncharacterized protein (TIGR01244 family)